MADEKDSGGALEIITSLPDAVKAVQELLTNPWGFSAVALVVFYFIFTKIPQHPWFQSILGRKDARIKYLESYIATTSSDVTCKAVAVDVRDAIVFESSTGIYAEAKWRDGLLSLHDRAGVSWLQMRRAWRYMEMKSDNTVQIRALTKGDKFEAGFNTLMLWVFLVMATYCFIVALVSRASANGSAGLIGLSLLLVALAIWSGVQNWPINTAKLISAELKKRAQTPSSTPA